MHLFVVLGESVKMLIMYEYHGQPESLILSSDVGRLLVLRADVWHEVLPDDSVSLENVDFRDHGYRQPQTVDTQIITGKGALKQRENHHP